MAAEDTSRKSEIFARQYLKVDAKSDAALARKEKQKPYEKSTVKNVESSQCFKVGAKGLEPLTPSV